MREVADRMWESVERARMERALKESDEKYRTLVHHMNQGYVKAKLLRNEQGTPTDQVLLELNPAFENLLGITVDLTAGRGVLEIVPSLDPWWVKTYERVLREGRPERMEREVPELGRWYDISIVSGKDDEYLLFYDDITKRKKDAAALRESEERQAFVLRFSDAIRSLTDAEEIENTAARLIGEYLRTEHAFCARIETRDNVEYYIVRCSYSTPGFRSLNGVYQLSDTSRVAHELHGGRTIAVCEVATDSRLTEEEKARYAADGFAAFLMAPLVEEGVLTGAFAVYDSRPRSWTVGEMSLLEEVAQRTWLAVKPAQAEATLREREARLSLVVESAKDYAIFVTDAERRVIGWWHGAEAVFGWTATEIAGQSSDVLFTPEDRELGAPGTEIETANAEGRARDVRWHVRKDGSRVFIEGSVWALPQSGRGPAEFLKIGQDVTERRAAQEELRKSEERFRLFVENVREYALIQTDMEGRITGWNPGAERLFGYAHGEVLFRPFDMLLPLEDREDGIIGRELALLAVGGRNRDGHRMQRKDGSRFWAEWVTEPMMDDAGKLRGTAKVLRDETERQQAEAALRTSLAEKEALLKEVHHRVKNNLQVITSLLNLQAGSVEDARVLELFEETRNRIQSIASIHELLYRSTSYASVNLSLLAKQLVPDLVRFYGVEDRVRTSIVGDGAAFDLERAIPYGLLLNELVSNALKHGFAGRRSGELLVEIEESEKRLLLRVRDDGAGLPPGFDVEQASTLGLRLVRILARQLRGHLRVVVSHGTVFELTMPARISHEENG